MLQNFSLLRFCLDIEEDIQRIPNKGPWIAEKEAVLNETFWQGLPGQNAIVSGNVFVVSKNKEEEARKRGSGPAYIGFERLSEKSLIIDRLVVAQINSKFRVCVRFAPSAHETAIGSRVIPVNDFKQFDLIDQIVIDPLMLPDELEDLGHTVSHKLSATAITELDEFDKSIAILETTDIMTDRLRPLLSQRTFLLLSTPHYYSQQYIGKNQPEISAVTFIGHSDNEKQPPQVASGNIFSVAVARVVEPPCDYTGFLILHDNISNTTSAVPINERLQVLHPSAEAEVPR